MKEFMKTSHEEFMKTVMREKGILLQIFIMHARLVLFFMFLLYAWYKYIEHQDESILHFKICFFLKINFSKVQSFIKYEIFNIKMWKYGPYKNPQTLNNLVGAWFEVSADTESYRPS